MEKMAIVRLANRIPADIRDPVRSASSRGVVAQITLARRENRWYAHITIIGASGRAG